MSGKVVALSKTMNNLDRAKLGVDNCTRIWSLGQRCFKRSSIESVSEMPRLCLSQARPPGRRGNQVGILEVALKNLKPASVTGCLGLTSSLPTAFRRLRLARCWVACITTTAAPPDGPQHPTDNKQAILTKMARSDSPTLDFQANPGEKLTGIKWAKYQAVVAWGPIGPKRALKSAHL